MDTAVATKATTVIAMASCLRAILVNGRKASREKNCVSVRLRGTDTVRTGVNYVGLYQTLSGQQPGSETAGFLAQILWHVHPPFHRPTLHVLLLVLQGSFLRSMKQHATQECNGGPERNPTGGNELGQHAATKTHAHADTKHNASQRLKILDNNFENSQGRNYDAAVAMMMINTIIITTAMRIMTCHNHRDQSRRRHRQTSTPNTT
jgi:hypothetical protein